MKQYTTPKIDKYILDNQISLILNSCPNGNNGNGHGPDCPCNNCNPGKHDDNNNNPY